VYIASGVWTAFRFFSWNRLAEKNKWMGVKNTHMESQSYGSVQTSDWSWRIYSSNFQTINKYMEAKIDDGNRYPAWNWTRVESEACLNPVVPLICPYPPPPQTNAWEKSNSSPRPGLDPTSPAARRKPTGHRPTNNVLGQQLEGRRLACDGAIRVWKSNGSCSLSLSSVTVIVADLWSLNGSVNLYYYCVTACEQEIQV